MSYVLSDASTFSGETRIKSVVSWRQKINLMSGAVVAQKVMSCGFMGACGFIVSRVVFCFDTIQTSCGTHPFSWNKDWCFFSRREISQCMTFSNPPTSVGEFMKTCTSTSVSCICLSSRVLILRNIFIFLYLDASVILFLNKHVLIDWPCYWLTDLLNTVAINPSWSLQFF
jgi:hypothetical protein